MPRSDADVIVVGIGTMGSAALWRAAERGARVLGIEQYEIGHDRGSGHGESRIIRTAYHEHPAYVPLVRSAWQAWRALEAESGNELLTRTGALMIGPPTGELIAGVLEAVYSQDLAHEILNPPAVAARFPQHVLHDEDVAVVEPDAGFLRPERAIAAMTSAAVAAGARIETRTRVLGIEWVNGGVAVRLSDRTVVAPRMIVCCGSWIGTLVPELARVLSVERQVPLWFPVREPAAYGPARFPVFIRDIDGHAIYGVPMLDGVTAKVALHHEGIAVADPERVDRSVHETDVAPVAALVARCLRGLDPAPARATVCMYTNAPDRHFVVGALPELDGVTVVSACSGHGFKFAPVIGEIAAGLALDGGTDHPIELFHPERFGISA